jgi:hypothetical protein
MKTAYQQIRAFEKRGALLALVLLAVAVYIL